MNRPAARRVLTRALATLLGAVAGAVLLSGTDQPVTAQPYPRWQELARPPVSARDHALGVHVGHRVLLLGGVRADGAVLRDGAAYDLRTGTWGRLRAPTPLTDRDDVVAAAGVAVLRHVRPGREASWWRYDPKHDLWSRMRHLPPRLSTPAAFGSEVYAVSGRRVVVYSVQLRRWTPLPPDRLQPVLHGRTVTATRAGTVVTGYAAHRSRPVADRWDGVRWQRSRSTPASPAAGAPDGATVVHLGGRTLGVRGDRAWIRLP